MPGKQKDRRAESGPDAAAGLRLQEARVARLATVNLSGRPTIIPICYVYDGRAIYTAIDRKPKNVPPRRLARIRNILKNPDVALVVDRYQEDWSRLWHVLVHGHASLIDEEGREEHDRAIRLLRRKYRQYRSGLLPDDALVIRIRIVETRSWGDLD